MADTQDQNQISSPIPGATIISSDGQISQNPDSTTENAVVDLGEPTEDFDSQEYENLKNLVSRKSLQLDELSNNVKELAESLKNILINDSNLSQLEDKIKESKREVTKRRQELLNSPEAQTIKMKLVEAREDMKDLEDSLSTQLLGLYQITGVAEFETPEGEVREFVIKAKVKAKRIKA